MLEHCPHCHTEAHPGQFTCVQCGHELQQNGMQLEALTYWNVSKSKRTFKYAAVILFGVLLTVVFHHIAPCIVGLGVAALLYIKDYK